MDGTTLFLLTGINFTLLMAFGCVLDATLGKHLREIRDELRDINERSAP